MAVHDVGTGDNRTSAMPNVHDVQTERQADGTQGITQKLDTASGAYVSTKDAQILVNDGTNDTILIGRQADGSYGIKIANEGYDVQTAAGPQQVAFNSSDLTIQIIDTIQTAHTRAPGAPAFSETITTGLKYAPPSLGYLSTYIFGAGQPTETGMIGSGGSWAGSADYSVYGQLLGNDGYVTISYPANTSPSTIEFQATILLLSFELPG